MGLLLILIGFLGVFILSNQYTMVKNQRREIELLEEIADKLNRIRE
ncbi:hypothetical protein [Bacillus horti]|uniref:YrzO family protein n=1 Tax=Caldalkalibacillus horti TaxID=77523 RepID=A0ABT9W4P9_9BACI|nr:hypothetical protein [Bacillus horti]MDQ0168231.1 hypothetical protein [Bacillus horti]